MASLPLSQRQVVGQYLGDVTVATDTTIATHRNALSLLSFKGHRLEDKADWTQFIMNKLQFSAEASRHSLWLLSPMELGIDQAADLTNVRYGGEDDLFIPSYYLAAAGEGFYPSAPDILSCAARFFVDSDLDRLHLAHDPVKDSGGGEMVLTFSRRPNGLWMSAMRWHPTIQHLLSCETPWLFCRAD